MFTYYTNFKITNKKVDVKKLFIISIIGGICGIIKYHINYINLKFLWQNCVLPQRVDAKSCVCIFKGHLSPLHISNHPPVNIVASDLFHRTPWAPEGLQFNDRRGKRWWVNLERGSTDSKNFSNYWSLPSNEVCPNYSSLCYARAYSCVSREKTLKIWAAIHIK